MSNKAIEKKRAITEIDLKDDKVRKHYFPVLIMR